MKSTLLLAPFEALVIPELKSAYTKNWYNGSVFENQDSQSDKRLLMDGSQIKVVQYFMQRRRNPSGEIGGCDSRFIYRLRIEFYAEDSIENQKKVGIFFEDLDDVINQKLGYQWSDLVSEFNDGGNYPDVRFFREIDSRGVFVGSQTYFLTE